MAFSTLFGILILSNFCMGGCHFSGSASTYHNSAESWRLVWSDEFDYAGLPDSSKWRYDVGYIANNEKQFYTRARHKNARVENGVLAIESRKESYQGYAYTSARLITKDKASWTYGRVEVRAKLPAGGGTWCVIWVPN